MQRRDLKIEFKHIGSQVRSKIIRETLKSDDGREFDVILPGGTKEVWLGEVGFYCGNVEVGRS
jgi:hypothetical protein